MDRDFPTFRMTGIDQIIVFTLNYSRGNFKQGMDGGFYKLIPYELCGVYVCQCIPVYGKLMGVIS